MYATLFYGQYDDSSRVLTFVNAGHNPPLLLRCRPAAGTEALSAAEPDSCPMERLTEGGTVLGVFPDAVYQSGVVQLDRGDLLVLYTDGISEAANDRDEEFGDQRLVTTLASKSSLRVDVILAGVLDEVVGFMSGAPPKDDMTLAIFRVQ